MRYEWDAENRLIRVSPRPSQEALFLYAAEYDYMGRRVGKRVWQWNGSAWVLVQQRKFLWDGWKLLLELDCPGGTGAPVPPTFGNTSTGSPGETDMRSPIACSKPSSVLVGVALLALTAITGCATYSAAGASYRHGATRLEVALPAGWWKFNPRQDAFVLTRDGLRLERIEIWAVGLGEPLPGTERRYTAGLLPYELAELSLGLLESNEQYVNVKRDRIEVATIAGREGYQADISYVDKDGLPKRLRLCGALIESHVCEFRFDAEQSVYFKRYLPAFEKLVASARVVK